MDSKLKTYNVTDAKNERHVDVIQSRKDTERAVVWLVSTRGSFRVGFAAFAKFESENVCFENLRLNPVESFDGVRKL